MSDEQKTADALKTGPIVDDGQKYKYAELLKPKLASGKDKATAAASKAKGDMQDAMKWFKTLSAPQQDDLVAMATGAKVMTKEAVAALSGKASVAATAASAKASAFQQQIKERGLSKTAQETATAGIAKAQIAFTTAMGKAKEASAVVSAKAAIKREEVLASETTKAIQAWVDQAKVAVDADAKLEAAKKTGGDALKKAQEASDVALKNTLVAREQAIKMSSVYLQYAQEQMTTLKDSDQGKKLVEKTTQLVAVAKGASDAALASETGQKATEAAKKGAAAATVAAAKAAEAAAPVAAQADDLRKQALAKASAATEVAMASKAAKAAQTWLETTKELVNAKLAPSAGEQKLVTAQAELTDSLLDIGEAETIL